MRRKTPDERRQYIRLNSVFPIEVFLPREENKPAKRTIQGFTCDVSQGGVCITVNDPDGELLSALENSKPIFDIHLNMPITHRPVEATVRLRWHEIIPGHRHKTLRMGVAYERIAPAHQKRIVSAARRNKWLPRIAVFFIIALLFLLGASQYNTMRLVRKNRALIASFHKVQETSDAYREGAGRVEKKYNALKGELEEKEKLIKTLSGKEGVEARLSKARSEKEILEVRLKTTLSRKEKAAALLSQALKKRRELEETTVKNMCDWLRVHQNKFTGLIMSFEGDRSISRWAFTYDQSLASQAFLISGDTKKASHILSFYKKSAKKDGGAYYNAYNAITGRPAESVVSVGPNIWIALAALQYTEKTKEKTYLGLAEDIAGWVILLKDKDGGVKGGPNFSWYSTEHNIDAYALFNMLYDLTGKEIYEKEKKSTLRWIRAHTYSEEAARFTRGKGDATIATDTMAWAIAAVGPVTLLKEGMNPEGIMKFAEEHCAVSTDFRRPDGSIVRVKGFDFGKAKNMARGGIVSTEWTAQMVVAFKVMAEYYMKLGKPEAAAELEGKARFYLDQLDKMVISSPSRSGQGAGCLPYASQPDADTGHGWRTPGGGDTGSVAGTAYTIFAKKGYNPLSLY